MPEFEPATEAAVEPAPADHESERRGSNSNAAAGNAALQRMIVATSHRNLNLRSAPAIEPNVVGSLTRGSTVESSGGAQNGFTQVTDPSSGRHGWASLQYLRPEHAAFARPPNVRAASEPVHHVVAPPHDKPAPKPDHQVVAPLLQPLPAAARDATRVAITPALLNAAVHPAALPRDTHQHETIAGQAFVRGAGDATDIDPNDVSQGNLGDCYFLSALAATARANPELIRRLIKQVGPHTYEVTLYKKDHFWSSRDAHKIVVTDQFPTDGHGHAAYAQPGDTGPGGPELWVMLMEKAFATLDGSYTAIESGYGTTGLDLLLPNGSRDYTSIDYSTDQIATMVDEALRSHRPITASTGAVYSNGAHLLDELKAKHPWLPDWFIAQERVRHEQSIKRTGAIDTHVYSIASIDMKTRHVRLQNPWGHAHLDLSVADFRSVFAEFSIGNRP